MGLFKKKDGQIEKVKKPIYKRVWFWVLIAVIVIAANGCGGNSSTSQAPTGQEQKQPAAPAEEKKAKYEILEQQVVKEEYGSRFVTGKIKNNAGRDVGYISIEINLYDKDGNQVGSTIDATNNLDKDGVWKFKAFIAEENAVSYKIKDVSGF